MKKILLPLLLLAILFACQPSIKQISSEQFNMAEQFLPKHIQKIVYNDGVNPRWIKDTGLFWYRLHTRNGKEFFLIDVETKTKTIAFDHQRMADALNHFADSSYTAYELPFNRIRFNTDMKSIVFDHTGEQLECDLSNYQVFKKEKEKKVKFLSPDKKWSAFTKDHNLFVKNVKSNEVIQLSDDGVSKYEYATSLNWYELTDVENPITKLKDTNIYWSPDSKKIATIRSDYRDAKNLYLWQSVPDSGLRAKVWAYDRALVGDEKLAKTDFVIFDIATKKQTKVKLDPVPNFLYWSTLDWKDDDHICLSFPERGYKKMFIYEVDANNGEPRIVTTEEMETYVDVNIFTYEVLKKSDELIMSSERDGWNHLYLFDWKSGDLKNQITKGEFVVRDIKHIDKEKRKIYFTAVGREKGRNPYLAHAYSVNFDGSNLQFLTSENAFHNVNFNEDASYFVDNYSRIDMPTIAVLRKAETGEIVMELEEADDADLLALGYQYPESYTVKARDGETDLWGVIFRPMNYDANASYAVIDNSYSGPQAVVSPQTFTSGYRSWNNSFTALGFVVITIDGLGTAQRSKKFHDVSYKNLGDIGADDHEKAIRELCERYDYLDVNRVGIYGHSAGGYDACRALLLKPDFYKVGVSSAGNHDHRLAKAWWPELYMGYPIGDNYDEQSNFKLADQLQGKLLLVHGDMDNNVNTIETMQMANAFMEANKDFDLLIVPNETHYLYNHKFFTLKRWNYFIEHLMGVDPVWDYKLGENFED